jgi:hypothetical protein
MFLLSRTVFTLNGVSQVLAMGGHMDIVNQMLMRGAKDFNWGLACSSRGGNIEIVELMVKLGANNFDDALSVACKGGHNNIAIMM